MNEFDDAERRSGKAVDRLVAGCAAQCHQRPGHHVHEAPDEFPVGGRLPLRGQLPGAAPARSSPWAALWMASKASLLNSGLVVIAQLQ